MSAELEGIATLAVPELTAEERAATLEVLARHDALDLVEVVLGKDPEGR